MNRYYELYQKIQFTLLAILVYRLGSFIPIAGIDSAALEELTRQNQSGILGMFNMLSGGSLGRMSIFALGIVPYITASIIIQLVSIGYKPLADMKKDGESGRRKMNQISRYLTILLATFQSFGVASWLQGINTQMGPLVVIDPTIFKVTALLTLVVGTMLLMWLGEQITIRGIGNGSSLIIFSGIVSGIPSSIISSLELIRKGSMNPETGILVLLLTILLIAVVVFFERAIRKVSIHYPKHNAVSYGSQVQNSSHMPLKLNTAGVIPPMFASSLLLFPLTITNFARSSQSSGSDVASWLAYHLGHGKPLFILLYSILIIFFSFFYTSAVFNSEEVSENLKKGSAFIPGIRPGVNTAHYFDKILSRLTFLGSIYLCVICCVPEILIAQYSLNLAISGTSVLIIVNVILETISQIYSHTLSSKYSNVMRKIKIKK